MKEAACDWLKTKTSRERSIMKKQANRARIFTIAGLSMIMSCEVGFAMLPFLGFSPHILNNITDPGIDQGRYFPIQESFPFDAIRSPTFEIVYFFLVLAMFGNGVAFTFPENLFGALVFHASGQFEILGTKMQHLFDDIKGYGDEDLRLFRMKLQQIVDGHVRLIGLMKITESTFKMIILSQIVGLTISTCGFGFGTLDTLSNPEVELSFVRLFLTASTTLSLMFQILIYCIASEVFAHHVSPIFIDFDTSTRDYGDPRGDILYFS
ncbi:hypothetical protein QAD02_000229 [Eretmocerus hayati]|uniref:Uncharacterized protein n=1 Tax=Eretmocerus hayati TaxID=131215 RepID=A0ACC2NHD0_9HYME|nr:hypothetical protein QAD02_000229 [Eretmocerus hayati]